MSVKTAAPPARAFTPAPNPLLLKKCACGGTAGAAGECSRCAAERESEKKGGALLRFGNGPAPGAVPASVGAVLRSPGRPLDSATRGFMEPRFGSDFGGVRVHTGDLAADSARAVNARAWTVGQDIAFAPGHYQPHTHEGRALLAHELAHTVQQSGLQRYPAHVQMGGPLEPQLEREAESAARAVMNGLTVPGVASRPGVPLVSRAPARCPEVEPVTPVSGAAWKKPSVALHQIGVKGVQNIPGDKTVQRFNVGAFKLPPEKGPVLNCWLKRAQAGALEAKYMVGDTTKDEPTKSEISQGGEDTERLRVLWVQKLGWNDEEAAEKWKAAEGKEFIPPKTKKGETCQMDHIIELQVGGNNVPQNIQLLGSENNGKSGRDIRLYLKEWASKIWAVNKDLESVILHFDSVEGASPNIDTCVALEDRALKQAGELAPDGKPGEDQQAYPVEAGGFTRELLVGKKSTKDSIDASDIPQNVASSTLIPGMILKQLERKKAGAIHGPQDVVKGCLDVENCALKKLKRWKFPVRLKGHPEEQLKLAVEKNGSLKLKPGSGLNFEFPYLSPGHFTRLEYKDGVGMFGDFVITPRAKFLPELHGHFTPDSFALTVPIDEKALRRYQPFPGFRVTKAAVDLPLYPEFKPSGIINVLFGTEHRKLAEGVIKIGGDSSGLTASVELQAFIPGVKNASFTGKYDESGWSGQLAIDSSQIELKYLESASLLLKLSQRDGLDASGRLKFKHPGSGSTFDLSFQRSPSAWAFAGRGVIYVPRLKPIPVEADFDGRQFHAAGKPNFDLFGVQGSADIDYFLDTLTGHSTVRGTAKAAIEKPHVKGGLVLKLNPNQKWSGEGAVTYKLKKFEANAAIILDENGKVIFKGGILIPYYKLFEPKENLFVDWHFDKKFPIPGLSIGPLGLQFTVGGAIFGAYSIGPGKLVNTRLEVTASPLEEDPDPTVTLVTNLYIPARVVLHGSISAGIDADAFIAEAWVKLNVYADANLTGGFSAENTTLTYSRGRITVDLTPTAAFKLLLGLGLDVTAHAEAGFWRFKVQTTKTWRLGHWDYDPDIGFKLDFPIHYDSGGELRAPEKNELSGFEKPDLDPEHIVKGSVDKAPPPTVEEK